MQHTGLADLLQNILRDAGQAHHTLVEEMESDGRSKAAVDSENANWYRFYAEYVAHRLTPYLCGMQCAYPKRKFGPAIGKPEPPLPLLAQGKWDTTTASRDAIRLGVANCHDTGECQGYGE